MCTREDLLPPAIPIYDFECPLSRNVNWRFRPAADIQIASRLDERSAEVCAGWRDPQPTGQHAGVITVLHSRSSTRSPACSAIASPRSIAAATPHV